MWSTSSTYDAVGVAADAIWERAYAAAAAWPLWNDALASAALDGPFAVGSRARVQARRGLPAWQRRVAALATAAPILSGGSADVA
jgi:hypothetical protein